MLLIGHSILFFNDEMFHPSFYTLSPIIGVCLIIWFSNKNELITKILSTKLFVGIGLISYSLYLWHYPIFAFARVYNFTEGNLFLKLFLAFIIVITSLISYYLVERPFRKKNNKFKVVLSLVLISISILIIVNLNVVYKDGFKNRLPKMLINSVVQPWNMLKNLNGQNCHEHIKGCIFNTLSNKKVFIIGDSHAGSLIFDLKDRVVKKNYQFITKTHMGCIFYPGFNKIDLKTQKVNKYCNNNYFQQLKQFLFKNKNSIIIFSGRLPLYISEKFFDNQEGVVERKRYVHKYVSLGKYINIQDSFKNEVLELSNNNKIILVYPIPETGWNVNQKIFDQWKKQVFVKNHNIYNFTTSYEVYKSRTKSSFELLDSIKGENIYRVYPHKLFCDTRIKNRCVTHDDEKIFYADDNHPSLKGAEMINDLIMREIEKIEFQSN